MPDSEDSTSLKSGSSAADAEQMQQAYGKSVWVETIDGHVEKVDRKVAIVSSLLERELLHCPATEDAPLALPKQVGVDALRMVLRYCRFHQATGRSDRERKAFDEKFIKLDTRRLCELTSAADSLEMKPLVELTSRAIARIIEGKTPEEIRDTFCLPDDLTEEEKLEPVKNATDDPRIRLLNVLYARKRKELSHRKAREQQQQQGGGGDEDGGVNMPQGDGGPTTQQPVRVVMDDRPLEDLLLFIDGDGGGGSEESGKKRKSKKKKSKQHRTKEPASGGQAESGLGHAEEREEDSTEESGQTNPSRHQLRSEDQSVVSSSAPQSSSLEDSARLEDRATRCLPLGSNSWEELFPEDQFEDEDDFGDLDPSIKEQMDREVEDFARRLNSHWQDRVQELLSPSASVVQSCPLSNKAAPTNLAIKEEKPSPKEHVTPVPSTLENSASSLEDEAQILADSDTTAPAMSLANGACASEAHSTVDLPDLEGSNSRDANVDMKGRYVQSDTKTGRGLHEGPDQSSAETRDGNSEDSSPPPSSVKSEEALRGIAALLNSFLKQCDLQDHFEVVQKQCGWHSVQKESLTSLENDRVVEDTISSRSSKMHRLEDMLRHGISAVHALPEGGKLSCLVKYEKDEL